MNPVEAYNTITTPFVHTGNTTEVIAMTHTVIAGDFPANGFAETIAMLGKTGSNAGCTVRCYIGGTGGTKIGDYALNTAPGSSKLGIEFSANNATNAQHFWNANTNSLASAFGQSASSIGTATIDFSMNQDVVWTVQLANASDTITVYNSRLNISAS